MVKKLKKTIKLFQKDEKEELHMEGEKCFFDC